MTDEPDNVVLQHLRALRADTAAIRRQLTSMGLDIARLRQDAAGDAITRSHAAERVDTIEDRLARIEAQLGIAD